MPTIDVQVHAYERNHPGRPWVGHLAGPASVTGDEMVAAMDAVGVDGALLVSPFSLYRYDASYALEVYAAHPGRFGLIKPVDTTDPRVAETIADWAATNGRGRRSDHAQSGRVDRSGRSRHQPRPRRRRAAVAARQLAVLGSAGPGRGVGGAKP